jgi:crotonobetainyl-CoA:carnitine CoA-transferase CaiB-like acyl-CoA transferase
MLHAGLTLMSEPLAVYETSGAVFRARSRPAYSQAYMFTCADGQLIAMHLSSADRNWDALMRVTGFPEPLRDPDRFGDRATRIAHFAEAQRILAPVFATRPSGDWLRELHAEGVSVAAVNAIDQLRDDPAIAALGVLGRTAPESTHGQQFTVVGAPGIGADPFEGPAPAIGEHTAEVLAELRTDA